MAAGLSDTGTRVFIYDAGLAADADRIVVSTNMKNGTYTIAAQPDVPRNITVSHTIVATGTDTLGTITIAGTNPFGVAQTEAITPTAGGTASGTKIFATVTSVTGAGWAIAGGNDTITVGMGSVIGYAVFVPVSKIGAAGGSMDKHESTCMSDTEKTYAAGRLDNAEIEFTYNYNSANAARVKAAMNGSSEKTIIICYPDKSGYQIVGVGTDRTDDASANSLLSGSFTFVVKSKTWDDDWSTVIG